MFRLGSGQVWSFSPKPRLQGGTVQKCSHGFSHGILAWGWFGEEKGRPGRSWRLDMGPVVEVPSTSGNLTPITVEALSKPVRSANDTTPFGTSDLVLHLFFEMSWASTRVLHLLISPRSPVRQQTKQ